MTCTMRSIRSFMSNSSCNLTQITDQLPAGHYAHKFRDFNPPYRLYMFTSKKAEPLLETITHSNCLIQAELDTLLRLSTARTNNMLIGAVVELQS